MEDKELVSALRGMLAELVGQERFELWFGATRLRIGDGVLFVEAPNRFTQDWLRGNFRKELADVCEQVVGRRLDLEFRINEALAPVKPAAPASQSTPSRAGKHPAPNTDDRRRLATLDSFIVGPSNRLAQASVRMVLEQPGCYSPLMIYGPTGVGKTHLLEALWRESRLRRPQSPAVYLSAEQFTGLFLEALRGSGLPSFRRKYRGVELLIVDDLQFFAGKKATLQELLHTIDTLSKERRQIVFASDRPPAAFENVGAELKTRLQGGVVCKVETPDFETRLGIVRSRAACMNVPIPEDVLHYVATHLTSHVRELLGALNLLQATSQATGISINKALAEEALAETIRHSGPMVKLSDIEKAICNVFGLEPHSLKSERKGKTVSHPRMLAMWLARKHTRAALTEIGEYFGGRSHSTVISAHKKVSFWMSQQTAVELDGKRLKVEDAIRRVEESLRAG